MTLHLNITPADTLPTLILQLYIQAAHAVFTVSVSLGRAHTYVFISPGRHRSTSASQRQLALPLQAFVHVR